MPGLTLTYSVAARRVAARIEAAFAAADIPVTLNMDPTVDLFGGPNITLDDPGDTTDLAMYETAAVIAALVAAAWNNNQTAAV